MFRTMRQGLRVIDADTHVNPSLDVLLRYADRDLAQRIDDLQPYRRTVKTVPGRGDAEDVGSSTILSVKPVRLQRVAGAKPSAATVTEGDRGFLSGRTHMGDIDGRRRRRARLYDLRLLREAARRLVFRRQPGLGRHDVVVTAVAQRSLGRGKTGHPQQYCHTRKRVAEEAHI
jgi:hypothetical protein